MATLHIHFDESGNFDFSNRGSRYYIFTASWTYEPAVLAQALTGLRFQLIKQALGESANSFHANNDAPPVRNRVMDLMLDQPGWSFASVVIEKRKVNPALYEPHLFYPKFLTVLLRFVFRGRLRQNTGRVLVYTDTLPFQRKVDRESVEATIKRACHLELPTIPFRVLAQRREANAWLQVTDYCCWGICRKWEHANMEAYDRMKARLAAQELDIMARGNGRIYY